MRICSICKRKMKWHEAMVCDAFNRENMICLECSNSREQRRERNKRFGEILVGGYSELINSLGSYVNSCDDEYDDDDDDEYDDEDDDDEYDDEDDGENDSDLLVVVDNAESLIKNRLREKTTKACYESLKEDVNRRYESSFSTSFQNYITRLALLLDEVVNKDMSSTHNYIAAINYICITILEDPNLYKNLKKINVAGNSVKHSTGNVSVDISSFMSYFNVMIDSIISKTGIQSFRICHIYVIKKKKKYYSGVNTVEKRLQKLKRLYDEGIVDKSEYQQKRKEILSDF